ncbi:MAG: hypothetical protein LUG93_15160, partial [Lachnospiraceae bacterium]|nr:hypothetical protein [Lachnospiraceae bacterium]
WQDTPFVSQRPLVKGCWTSSGRPLSTDRSEAETLRPPDTPKIVVSRRLKMAANSEIITWQMYANITMKKHVTGSKKEPIFRLCKIHSVCCVLFQFSLSYPLAKQFP